MSFAGNVSIFPRNHLVPMPVETKNETRTSLEKLKAREQISTIMKEEFLNSVTNGTRTAYSYTLDDMKPEKVDLWFKIIKRKIYDQQVTNIKTAFEKTALEFTKKHFPKAMGLDDMTEEAKACLDRHISQEAARIARSRENRMRGGELPAIILREPVVTVNDFVFRDEHFKGKPQVMPHEQIDKRILESRSRMVKRYDRHLRNTGNVLNQQAAAQRQSLFSSLGLLKFVCEKKRRLGNPILVTEFTEELLLSYRVEYQSFLADQHRQELEATLEEKNEAVLKPAPQKRGRKKKQVKVAKKQIEEIEESAPIQHRVIQKLSPFGRMIEDLNNPFFPVLIKLHERVKRWFGEKDPRTFKDWRNRYSKKNDPDLKQISDQHNMEGIDKLLSLPHFLEKYCFSYPFQGQGRETKEGIAFKAILNGGKGVIYAALHGDCVYHAMHHSKVVFDASPMLTAISGVDISQPDDENQEWQSPFTVTFEAGENETIVWKRGTKPQEDGVKPKHGTTIIILPLGEDESIV